MLTANSVELSSSVTELSQLCEEETYPEKSYSVVSTSVSSDHDAENMDSSEVAYAIPDIKCEPPDEDDIVIIKEENISDNHENSSIGLHQNDDDDRFEDYPEDMTHHYETYADNSEQEERLGHSTLSGSSSTIPVLSIPQHSRSTFSNLTRPTFSNLARPTFSSLTRYNGNKSLTPSKFNKSSKKTTSRFTSGTGGRSSSRNSQPKGALVCQHCNSTFGQKSTYYRHIREKHTMGKTFRCKFCSKLFQSSDSRRTHIAAEHKQFKFNCEICNARFNFANKLALHKLKFHSIYNS